MVTRHLRQLLLLLSNNPLESSLTRFLRRLLKTFRRKVLVLQRPSPILPTSLLVRFVPLLQQLVISSQPPNLPRLTPVPRTYSSVPIDWSPIFPHSLPAPSDSLNLSPPTVPSWKLFTVVSPWTYSTMPWLRWSWIDSSTNFINVSPNPLPGLLNLPSYSVCLSPFY